MIMCNPPHPGEILKEMYLEPMGITVTDAAKHLGISRATLSNLVNERSSVSGEMAIRLSKAFSTSIEFWINLQHQYDLWMTSKMSHRIKVQPFDLAA